MKADRSATSGERPLAGRTAWLITDGKAGMDVQCVGVAHALDANAVMKHVRPGPLARFLAPWGVPRPTARFGKAGSAFAPPWPDITIATGRHSIPYLRALRRAARDETFTVVIQDPRTGTGTADLVVVPEHDRLSGPNVMKTLTAPHNFSRETLAGLRASPPRSVSELPQPRIAVLLGGPNAIYTFSEATLDYLISALKSLAVLGASFLITPSRRTPGDLLEAVSQAIGDAPNTIWRGEGENPYPVYLANADFFIVTADSVNITGEACASGKPVYVLHPEGGSEKFRRFHDALRRYGATRPLPALFRQLEVWNYAPLDSAPQIAREIERRWLERRTRSVTGSAARCNSISQS